MRIFTIISILLALAVTAILWQKLLVNSTDQLPDPADYSTVTDNQAEVEYVSDECNEDDQDSSECEPEPEQISAEQNEMMQQRQQGHDVMMNSFDEKFDKYKGQINGRQ
ncbi:MAG: hypothetical protein KAJ95_06555 [Gammaproteobacteria bacterium]|nr:hypothetical protein [Gammaproteobacteria bacterium]